MKINVVEETVVDEVADKVIENQAQIQRVEHKINEATKYLQRELMQAREKDAKLREELYQAMDKYEVDKFENDFIVLTRVKPTTRKSFDSKRFKEDKPELYKKYTKVSDVKGYVKVKGK